MGEGVRTLGCRSVWRAAISALVLAAAMPTAAGAAVYRFEDAADLDHRDQWGLRLELGTTLLASSDLGGRGGAGAVGTVELGLSFGLPFTGHEVSMRLRPLFSTDELGLLVLGGYRAYAGDRHWKTYADLDLALPIVPGPAVGLRLGVGVMYDPTRNLGFALGAGAFGAVGAAMITGFDLAVGVQLRFE